MMDEAEPKGMLAWIWLAILVLILDQASKALVVSLLDEYQRVDVLPVFSWILIYNEGAAFSFLSSAGGWQRWVLALLATGVSAWLVLELRRLPKTALTWAIACALVLGGALGNLADRLLIGAVRDFILVHWQEHYFPAFNLADSAITIGATLWIALIVLDMMGKRGNPKVPN